MIPPAVSSKEASSWLKRIKPFTAPDVKLMFKTSTVMKTTVIGTSSERM
jgi:hypothetical protein